jgi:hypothetical protein
MKTYSIAPPNYHLQPADIDASRHLFDAFDHHETEISAGWIVEFMQARGEGWVPFTYEEIDAFYGRKHKNGFTFNRLVDPEMIPPSLARAFAGYFDERIPAGGGWVVLGDDKRFRVTVDFVERCHMSRPAQHAPTG